MAESLETQLTRVQAAIARIEEWGADRSVQSRRVVEAQLKTLYEREASLVARIAATNAGGLAVTYAARRRPV